MEARVPMVMKGSNGTQKIVVIGGSANPTEVTSGSPVAVADVAPVSESETAAMRSTELYADVQRLVGAAENSAVTVAESIARLCQVAQKHSDKCAKRTAEYVEVLLQSSSFVAFQAEECAKNGNAMLDSIEEIHKQMTEARQVLAEVEKSKETLTLLEDLLTQLERANGVAGAALPSK